MGDGEFDHLSRRVATGEWSLRVLDAHMLHLADEAELSVRIKTPGKRPASHRIWKPLQTPSTSPPRAACSPTARMIGALAAIAPQRR